MSDKLPIRGLLRLLCGAVALIALALCGAAVTTAHAASQPQLVPGNGAWLEGHTDFVGFYRAYVTGHWVKVYCVSPTRRAPGKIGLRTVSRLPSTTRTVTRMLAETLSVHGDADTATVAEAVSQALNEEMGNHDAVARRASQLPARVRRLAARFVAEARRQHGPFALHLSLPTSPLPGQSGTGTVTMRAPGGGIGGDVTLRHTGNVELPSGVRTSRTGHASFPYRTTGAGPVHIAATARSAPSTVRASRADSSTQQMITWSPRASAHTSATYQAHGARFTHRYACTAVCDGHPLVTLAACAPANRYRSRITYWYDGQFHRVGFAPADTRRCASWQVVVADGVSVSATWQYRKPRGWTAPLPAAGAFTVDCPAAPPVAVLLSYDCQTATIAAVLGRAVAGALEPLHNTSQHRMVLEVDGAATSRTAVPSGAEAQVHTFPVTCGAHETMTVRGGVQRSDGSYNYGQPTTVQLP
jgi:hypothetical protein